MTSNLILRPNTELSSEVFTKKTSLIARGLNEISLLKPSPESLYQTGMDYYEGSNGKPWDILKAYAYLVKSAEQGFVLAQWRLSCMFLGDEAVERNEEKAWYWHEKAALNGHLEAMYYLLDETSETYIEELTYLAESGCSTASNAFVKYYFTGDYEHIKKDMKQAWYWVKWSIEQSICYTFCVENATAEFWGKVDKDNGYWLPYDWLCKERWYSAAEREQYYENRMIWLIEKAQQGEAFAQFGLGCELSDINDNFGTLFSENWQLLICEELFYQQAMIAADEPIDWGKLAVFWFTKSAKQGFWAAQYMLGGFCDIDHEKAVYWLRRSVEQEESSEDYFEKILAFNETDMSDAPKFTFEELEHYRLNNQDSI